MEHSETLRSIEVLFIEEHYSKAYRKLNHCSDEEVVHFFKRHKDLNGINKKQNFKSKALCKFWHSKIPVTHLKGLLNYELKNYLILSFFSNPAHFNLKVMFLIFKFCYFDAVQCYKLCQSYRYYPFYYGLMILNVKYKLPFAYQPKFSFKQEIKWIK